MGKFHPFLVSLLLFFSQGAAQHSWCTTDVCTQRDADFVYVASPGNSSIYPLSEGDQAYKAGELSLWLGGAPLDPRLYEKGGVSKIFRFETKAAPISKSQPFPFFVIGIFMCVAFGTVGLIAWRKKR